MSTSVITQTQNTLRLPPAYLAPVQWYSALVAHGGAVIECCEHYVKQTARNRCRIAMPDGPQDLIIPVVAAPGHTPIHEIRISDHGNWRHHHWSALRTAYGKSPFFEYYADDFVGFYEQRYTFLVDFIEQLHLKVAHLIDIEAPVVRSTTYAPPTDFSDLPIPQRPYYQVFSQRLGFLPGLSIVDLLFNLGPEALLYLMKA